MQCADKMCKPVQMPFASIVEIPLIFHVAEIHLIHINSVVKLDFCFPFLPESFSACWYFISFVKLTQTQTLAFTEWTSINLLEIWSNKFKWSVWVSNHGWMCLAEYARSIVLRQYLYLEGSMCCVPKMPKYGDKFQATHPFGRQFRHCVPWHFQRSSSNGKK